MGAGGVNINFSEGKEITIYENELRDRTGEPVRITYWGDFYDQPIIIGNDRYYFISGQGSRKWFCKLSNTKKRIEDDIIHHSAHIYPKFTVEWKETLWSGFLDIIPYSTKGKLICIYCQGVAYADLVVRLFRLRIYKRPPSGARDLKVELKNFSPYVYQISGSIYCQDCGSTLDIRK